MAQFAEPLQRALTAFAHGSLSAEVPAVGGQTTIVFNDHTPTPLRVADGPPVAISISLKIRLDDREGEPYVKTVGWSHAVFVDGVDRLRYDWHPFVTPLIPFPHVHIEDAKAHVPTGRILVEDVLVAALEYGALPLSKDWKDRLRTAKSAFEATAEWGISDSSTGEHWLARWDDDGQVVDDSGLSSSL